MTSDIRCHPISKNWMYSDTEMFDCEQVKPLHDENSQLFEEQEWRSSLILHTNLIKSVLLSVI